MYFSIGSNDLLLAIPPARKRAHAPPISEASTSLHRPSIKRAIRAPVQTDSPVIIHLKLLQLRPHALKLKKTSAAVINSSRAVPWLAGVGITALTSLAECQSAAKKTPNLSQRIWRLANILQVIRYVLRRSIFKYTNSRLHLCLFKLPNTSSFNFFSFQGNKCIRLQLSENVQELLLTAKNDGTRGLMTRYLTESRHRSLMLLQKHNIHLKAPKRTLVTCNAFRPD